MSSQLNLSFEQALLDAAREARATRARTMAEAKRQREAAKLSRRLARENTRRQRTPDQVALCGLYYYNRSPRSRAIGNYWKTCVRCGQPLQYYDSYEEAKAHRRDCRRPEQEPESRPSAVIPLAAPPPQEKLSML